MDDVESIMPAVNAPMILWIVGIVAAVFVIAIIFDSIRRKRADKRGGSKMHRESHSRPGFFKSLSLFVRQFKQELARRRRHKERGRDRER